MGDINMGNTDGKITNRDEEILQDISNQCELSFEELKTEYEEWLVKFPSGEIEEREFLKILTKILPKYSKEDLKKVSHHVFRVYDNDSNNKISFKEFIFVYNILAFGDIDETLGRMFQIFDIDHNGTICREEMKKVITDLAVLFETKTQGELVEAVFAEMDENRDERITREEFIKSIKEGNKYGQDLAARLVRLHNTRN